VSVRSEQVEHAGACRVKSRKVIEEREECCGSYGLRRKI
jgi:hypothetical protein